MDKGRGRPSQSDIARELGISISTVSRALANEPGISSQVRDEVIKLARSIGYKSKHAAPVIRTGRAVALLPLGSAASAMSSFYVGIAEGMKATADSLGLSIDVKLVNEERVTLEIIERHLKQADARAVLLAGIDAWDELIDWCEQNNICAVLANGIDPQMRISSVSPCNFYGAYLATRTLLAAGHRKILHYTHNLRPTILERRRGFEAAIAETEGAHGIVVSTSDCSTSTLADNIMNDAYGVTALFSWNDVAAVEILEGLHGGGRPLPKGFSIVGFDDLPIAAMSTPRLSTVSVDREAIGHGAVRLLVQHMQGNARVQQLQIGLTFVEGGTIHPR